MGTCPPSPTTNHFSHHPFTCTEGAERTKSEFSEHCFGPTPQERTRVGFLSTVDRISINRPAPFSGDAAKRPLSACFRHSLPPAAAVEQQACTPPAARGLG